MAMYASPPRADICLGQKQTSGRTSIKGGCDFACVFLANFGARYICADAGSNWNQGTPPTLFVRVRLLDLSIRKTDGEIERRKLLQCCRSPHAQAHEIALSANSIQGRYDHQTYTLRADHLAQPFQLMPMSPLMLDVGARLVCRCKQQDREDERDGAGGYHKDHNVLVGKKHGFHRKPPLLCPPKPVRPELWCC